MTAIYFQLLRFLANQQADAAIRRVLRSNKSEYIQFRYSEGCLSTRVKLLNPHGPEFQWVEDLTRKITAEIQRINAERQSTLDQLDRERYGTEDSL
jgi:hypothetical protein